MARAAGLGDVEVTGVAQIRALAARFRAAGSESAGLKKQLRADIRIAMVPMQRAVQTNARAIPSQGKSSHGLRRALASATKIKLLLGNNPTVRLFVDPARLPFKGAANVMEGRERWRHPVFGDSDVWVQQDPHPYFYRAVNAHLNDVRRSIDKTLTTTANRLKG